MTSVGSRADASPSLAGLAADPTWLRLGHYERSGRTWAAWRSAIHPGDFFLAANGSTDPLTELQATVAAFNASPGTNLDQHAQCRFPARLQWLRRRLGDSAVFRSDIACPAYIAWTQAGTISSVSVVLATGFLGNPASYYGHTLLKFNFREGEKHTTLLDESASYGAILDGRHDNPVTYIVKSITHGYDAGFSHIHFYYHDHNYGNHELRDLWEYRLSLSAEDVNLVVAHTWELLGKRYTYEFFHGNCAYQMAKLIEVVDGVDIVPQHRPWIIPQAVIQKLSTARYQGRALVEEAIYHPSRQSRFYDRYRHLAQNDRKILRGLVVKQLALDGAEIQSRSTPSKQAIVDTLLDYYQSINNPLAEAAPKIRMDYAAALSMRFQLPPAVAGDRPPAPSSPDHARPPGWVQLAAGHSNTTGDVLSLRFRAAYYDPMDFDSGHVKYGSLAMGDVQVDFLRDRIRVNRLEVIHIESVNPGISGLPGDRGGSWKLGVGAEQARLWCKECLVARAQVDVGYGRQWNPWLFGAWYLGGALQSDRAGQGTGFGRTSVSAIASFGNAFRTRLGYEYRAPVGTRLSAYGVAQFEMRWLLNLRSDFRFRFDRDRANQVSAGFGVYW